MNPEALPKKWRKKVRVCPHTGCWVWQGYTSWVGYATVKHLEGGKRRTRSAHSVIYTLLKGAIPEGLELDHLCERKNCVNPLHMEPVTHSENLKRAYKSAAYYLTLKGYISSTRALTVSF